MGSGTPSAASGSAAGGGGGGGKLFRSPPPILCSPLRYHHSRSLKPKTARISADREWSETAQQERRAATRREPPTEVAGGEEGGAARAAPGPPPPPRSPRRLADAKPLPFIQFSVNRAASAASSIMLFNYVSLLVQEFDIQVEEPIIWALLERLRM